MDLSEPGGTLNKKLEIRFFGQLRVFADQQGWPFPCYFEIENECSACQLAELMGVPLEKIEGVFVNGIGKPLDSGWVKPGDRVGFIPYGIPGPYRVLLGFYKRPEDK